MKLKCMISLKGEGSLHLKRWGGGGLINKIFYGEAPPRGSTTYLFITLVYKMVYKRVPYEQRFLSCMAFSVYEVVACQSRSWFVYITGSKLTSYVTEKRRERLRKRQKQCKSETSVHRVPIHIPFLFKKAPLLYTCC